jgi:hypothetical protein
MKQPGLFDPIIPADFTEMLFQAYFDCRRNKRNTPSALKFELHFEKYLFELDNEIRNGTYQPGRSTAFVVTKPVKREVFAAPFRDRVVHHWLIKKLEPLFEELFIEDAYACRSGKGTHFGIQRIRNFIHLCAQEHMGEAYVLKLDIRGFFMHISRPLLFEKLKYFLRTQHQSEDLLFILDIAGRLIFNDPTKNCIIKGDLSLWDDLPRDKSLFYAPADCGLPIGNLTSQVFANFYLNDLDHFISKNLQIKYYGRYVDDFVLVHHDRRYLAYLITRIENYLKAELMLQVHPKKRYLQHYTKGLSFLGVMIKPNRIYVGNRIKSNFYKVLNKHNEIVASAPMDKTLVMQFVSQMNSYLGIMKHYQTYRLRKNGITKKMNPAWWKYIFVVGLFWKVVRNKRALPL